MLFKVKHFIFFVLTTIWAVATSAQVAHQDKASPFPTLQDSLTTFHNAVYQAENDRQKVEKNAFFIRKLVETLRINNSFSFGFDSLKRVSILKSPDSKFRIFTWFIPLSDGTYRYYGAIQLATADGSLLLNPLNDAGNNPGAANQPDDLQAINNARDWFGAAYYEIIPLGNPDSENTAYILLGWKGHSSLLSKKVIEVLTFENNEPVFGKNIFETSKNSSTQNRVIFQYNKQNIMSLWWDKKQNMIVFDHLVPIQPDMDGKYEYYASDSSFDAYKINGDKLSFMENIELRNEPGSNDEQFRTPVKASEVKVNQPF